MRGNRSTLLACCVAQMGILLLSPLASAETRLVAQDNASNYTAWSGNEGVGLDTWVFRVDVGGGFFIGNGNGDLNWIATDSKAWGTWANDGGGSVVAQYVAAYRGFGWNGSFWTNRLEKPGDRFAISFEQGDVELNASCGFALRNGNSDFTAHNFDAGSRFQFGLYSNSGSIDANYSIFDGSGGKLDTGVARRNSGLDLVLMLTASNAYSLAIYDATNSALITNIVSTLAGSGTLDSLSLFNRDTDTADNVYFNKIEIWREYPPTVFMVK